MQHNRSNGNRIDGRKHRTAATGKNAAIEPFWVVRKSAPSALTARNPRSNVLLVRHIRTIETSGTKSAAQIDVRAKPATRRASSSVTSQSLDTSTFRPPTMVLMPTHGNV